MTCKFFLENETVNNEPANVCEILRIRYPHWNPSCWIPSNTDFCHGKSDGCPLRKLREK